MLPPLPKFDSRQIRIFPWLLELWARRFLRLIIIIKWKPQQNSAIQYSGSQLKLIKLSRGCGPLYSLPIVMSSLWGEKYLDCKQKNKTERIGKYLIGIYSADLTETSLVQENYPMQWEQQPVVTQVTFYILILYFSKNKIKRRFGLESRPMNGKCNPHFQAWCQYDDDDRL